VFVVLAVRVILRRSYRRHLETRPIQQIGPDEATDNGTLLAQRHALFRPKMNSATRGGTVADERFAGDRSVGCASGARARDERIRSISNRMPRCMTISLSS